MKYLLFISFLFYFSPACTQDEVAALSEKLTHTLQTDKEKVIAIFNWITENITYSTKKEVAQYLKNNKEDDWKDDDRPLLPLTERVARIVLKRKMGVCDGYARLFTALCDDAGIRSELVIGFAKTTRNKPVSKMGVNHYWNAVFFDGKWHLLDATWASGYLSLSRNEFIRDYDGAYFLADPEIFIQDHYPDDLRWTLLPDTKIPKEFLKAPFKQKSFSKYQITSFSPTQGVINAFIGDTISLKLETAIAEDRRIASSQIVNASFFNFSSSWVFPKPEINKSISGKPEQCVYKYAVNSDKIQWLYLIYNNDLVLRYKINVKNKKDGSTSSL